MGLLISYMREFKRSQIKHEFKDNFMATFNQVSTMIDFYDLMVRQEKDHLDFNSGLITSTINGTVWRCRYGVAFTLRPWKEHFMVLTNIGLFFYWPDNRMEWKEYYKLNEIQIERHAKEVQRSKLVLKLIAKKWTYFLSF